MTDLRNSAPTTLVSRRVVDAMLGCCYLLLVGALLAGAVLVYDKAFVDRTSVVLNAGTLGNAIQTGSDVKLRGVPVGTVDAIEPTATGARLTLALEPEVAETLPSHTTARLLPKTLFGERYVSLVVSTSEDTNASSGGLRAGAEIQQDSSAEAVELQELFDEMLPMLQALQPDKLTATLGELAAMLRGQGTAIGDSMAAWNAYLAKLNPLVPQMADDLGALGRVATQYADAMPDLLDALDTMTTTAATMVDQRDQLSQVFATVIDASDASTGWVRANDQTIEVLAEESRAALQAVAPYSRQFPCLLRAVRDFVPKMDATLGKGTDEPGMHVVLNVVPTRGKYVAGRDAVSYQTGKAPRCPYVTGQTGAQPVGRAASGGDAAGRAETPTDAEPAAIAPPPSSRLAQVDSDLGEANSPAENQLIAELLAASEGLAPTDYPDWASLLVGPTLRGAEVTLR
ncbi:MAG TPA: MCE family protein [Nocardioides sp.]|uniref:MCE family protein n=1 Tax=Nocardioides sp. TaxID=35761 RepID=UPI002EDABC1D